MILKKRILFFIFLFSSILLYSQEICNNGIDDDGDGLIDCYDPECSGSTSCDSFFYNHPLVYCKYIPHPQATFVLDPLWVSPVGLDTRQTVTAGDIDGDGFPEVICYNNTVNYLQILDGKTGASKLVITTPSTVTTQYDGPSIADTDNDGLGEIYVITDDNYLRCYENNGTAKAGFTPPLISGNREYTQSIADFNGDGIPEIYVGHEIFNSLTGALIATGGATASSGANGNNAAAYPVAADVLPPTFCADCAGLELICGNEVYSVNIATGIMILQKSAPVALKDGFTSIADYNKDGKLDVIVSTKGDIYVWDPRTGLQIGTTYTIPGTNQGGHANVADYDGNGWPEIGAGGQNIFVALTDFSGGTGPNLKWSKAIVDGSGRTTSTSFDFEGDGAMEVVYRDEGTLYVWDGATGNVKASTPCGSGTRTEYPAIVDVDGNGEANIVCTCAATSGAGTGVVKAFKSKTQPWVFTRKVMNQHSYFAVNINDNLTIPKNQQNHAIVPILNTFLNQPPVTDKSGNPIFIPAADVIVTIDTVKFSTCSNPNTVNVTLTFCDTGYVNAPKGMKVSFYNGDPLSGGTLIVTDTTTNIIRVDSCITQTFTIPYSGPINLFVYANDKGTSPAKAPELSFIECDSTNNYDNISIASAAVFSLTNSFVPPTCNGSNNGSATVSVTGSTAPYSYSWNTNPVQTTATANNLTAGTYICNITDVGGCTATSAVTITEPAALTTSISGTTTVCPGASTTLTATGGGSYNWSTGDMTAAATVSPIVTSNYTVTVTNAGCTASATIQVTVGGSLTPFITGTTTICSGTSTILTTSGGSIYSWSDGSTVSSITVSPTSNTTYSVTVSSGMCSGTASVQVTVNPNPVPIISGTTTICSGQSTTLTANAGGTYSWSTGVTSATISISPLNTTIYSVTVTTNGCSGSETAQVIINPIPIPVITGTTTICTGQNTILTSGTAGPFLWSTGEITGSITVAPTSTKTYSVSVTANGCTGTVAQMVTVIPSINASITGNNICVGESVMLTASGATNYLWNTGAITNPLTDNPLVTTTYTVIATTGSCADTTTYTVIVNPLPIITATGDSTISYGNSVPLTSTGGGTYNWTPPTGLSCTNCANPIATPIATTQYCVTIMQNNCVDSACVTITIDNKCGDNGDLYVPNGFSPNNDGQNDVLYVRGDGVVEIYWAIYDRWGEKVFETTNPKQGWDGTYKSKQLDAAVFVYYLKVTCFSGEDIIQKGNVAIIK